MLTELVEKPEPRRVRSRVHERVVLRAVEELCAALQPGDVVPSHPELARCLDVSERLVRRALDELKRQGKVVRRVGSGTFVAERPAEAGGEGGAREAAGSAVDSRTIVAIAEPDRAIFDRAMSLLFHHAVDAELSLVCRLADRHDIAPMVRDVERGARGVVVFGRALLPLAERLQEAGHRVVLVGTPYAGATPGVPVVQGDQEQGGYLATRHLLDLGHRRIAFRGSDDWEQMQRHRGHRRALSEARRRGIEAEESAIFEDEYQRWRRAPEVACKYFERPQAPTGIVAWDDQVAVSLLGLLSYAGLRVPQDVSVIGYDNLPQGEQMLPALTTVDGALEQQLQAALCLLTREAAPSRTHTTVVLPALIRRDSTARAAR